MKWQGVDALARELQRKSETDFDKVTTKNLLEMRNRGVKSRNPSQGGTPVDSAELRLSMGVNKSRKEVGYTKHYAPHVEYGYRLVRNGKQIGYVKGQYFLKTNVNIQKPIYHDDLKKELNK